MVRGVLLSTLLGILPTQARVGETSGCDPISGISADRVYVHGSDGFDEARMDQYAQYLGTHTDASAKLNPAVLVSCTKEEQVQSAIQFANQCGYKVTVRSGGHSYTGASSCNFDKCMQLDLQNMNKTTVSGKMITAEPGIRLIDFANMTLWHGLSVPHGACTGVGLGGHLQSSAWGMLSHSWGSGLDHVQSFRMVLADGSVQKYSRDDANSTVFRSVLGSAPGSWGIITQYEMEGIPDSEGLFTRAIHVQIKYSKENLLAAIHQTQFISQDQETRNLRDMKLVLFIAPPTDGPESADDNVFITVYSLWTGIDSGYMNHDWKELYLRPFWNMEHEPFPSTVDIPMGLSAATQLMINPWVNHHDRYAVSSYHSDHWWDDEFLQVIADELDERVAMIPDVYPSFQFLPLGSNTQWARNAGMNALTWRDTRQYVDEWMFVKNESRYDEVVARMRDFREKNRKYWQHLDGSDRYTWMSPMTIYENATDLRIPSVARSFFPNQTQYNQLQLLKAELDPTDLFSNKGTIPLPGHIYV